MRKHGLIYILAVIVGLSSSVWAERSVQGLVGATKIDEDEIVFNDIPGLDEAVAEGADLPTLFTAGASVMEYLWGSEDTIRSGIEYGVLVSFGSDDRDVAGSSGSGVIVVNVDSSLWLTDVFAGLFIQKQFDGGPSLYVGGGPLLMIGGISGDFVERDVEDRSGLDLDESDTAFGAGGYVRAGIEFPWKTGGTFGLGVRAFTSTIDFEDTLGEVDLQGLQGFVGYSQNF